MSKELKNPEIVKDMDSLQAKIAVVREAQEKYANFTQEQVDKIFNAAATSANQMRIPLAQMAVEETGMGLVEDKVIKNNYAAEYIYNKYKTITIKEIFRGPDTQKYAFECKRSVLAERANLLP